MSDDTARLAQQCRAPDGTVGSFLYSGWENGERVPVSPVFPDTLDLFRWINESDWLAIPGTMAGEYRRVRRWPY